MKRTFILALILTLLFTMLTGCNNTETSVESDVSSNASIPEVIISEDINNDTTYIPEGSDFIYADKSMTEIIGLTDQCNSSLVLIFPETVNKISNISLSTDSQITTVIFLNDNVTLNNVTFSGSKITTVQNLPKSMTVIPNNMFYGCTEFNTLGNEVGVITIPDYITNIEPDAFGGCTKITKINATNIDNISERAFEGCTNLIEFTFSPNLKSIGCLAFYMCGFESISFPNTLETIGDNAFALNTKLIEVYIPENTKVNHTAFEHCESLITDIIYNTTEDAEFEHITTSDTENVEVEIEANDIPKVKIAD